MRLVAATDHIHEYRLQPILYTTKKKRKKERKNSYQLFVRQLSIYLNIQVRCFFNGEYKDVDFTNKTLVYYPTIFSQFILLLKIAV